MILSRVHQPQSTMTLADFFNAQNIFGTGNYPLSSGRLRIEFDPLLDSIRKNIPSRTYSVPEKIPFIQLIDDLAHQAGEWEALEVYRYLRKRYPDQFARDSKS